MFEAVCRASIGHEEAFGSLPPPLLCPSTERSGPRTHAAGRTEVKKSFHTTSSEIWTAVTGELIIIIILIIIIKNF